jgi:hypothetical protein
VEQWGDFDRRLQAHHYLGQRESIERRSGARAQNEQILICCLSTLELVKQFFLGLDPDAQIEYGMEPSEPV